MSRRTRYGSHPLTNGRDLGRLGRARLASMPRGGVDRCNVGKEPRAFVTLLCLNCRTEHLFRAAVPLVDGAEITFEPPSCGACGRDNEWSVIALTPV